MHAFRPTFSSIAEHRLVSFAETPSEATRIDSNSEKKEPVPAQNFLERGRDLVTKFFKSPETQKKIEEKLKGAEADQAEQGRKEAEEINKMSPEELERSLIGKGDALAKQIRMATDFVRGVATTFGVKSEEMFANMAGKPIDQRKFTEFYRGLKPELRPHIREEFNKGLAAMGLRAQEQNLSDGKIGLVLQPLDGPNVIAGQRIDSGEKKTDLPVQLKDAPPAVVAIFKVLQELVNMLSGKGERGASIEDLEKNVQGLKETKKEVEAQASGSESKELQERINRLSQRISELEARIAQRERDHAAHARRLEQEINVQGAPVLTGVRAEARGDVFVVRGSETQIKTISDQMSQRGFNFKADPQTGLMTIYAENGKLPTCRDLMGGSRGALFTETQNAEQRTEVGDRCQTEAHQKVECLTQRLNCIKQQYDCMLLGAERMKHDMISREQCLLGSNAFSSRRRFNSFGGRGAGRLPGSFGNSPNFGGGFAPQQGFGHGPNHLDFEQMERQLEAKRQEYAEVGRELQKAKREAAQPRAIPHVVEHVPSGAPDIVPGTGSNPNAIPRLDQRPPTRRLI